MKTRLRLSPLRKYEPTDKKTHGCDYKRNSPNDRLEVQFWIIDKFG